MLWWETYANHNLLVKQQVDKLSFALVRGNRQRSVSRTEHREGVNISSILDEDVANFYVIARSRLHKRGESRLGPVFNVSLPIH